MTKPWTGSRRRVWLVCTAITPGIAAASLVSIDVTRAWAMVERTNATWAVPAGARSSK